MASVIAWYIAMLIAFFFSGRAISMVATPEAMAVLMVIAIQEQSAFWHGAYGRQQP